MSYNRLKREVVIRKKVQERGRIILSIGRYQARRYWVVGVNITAMCKSCYKGYSQYTNQIRYLSDDQIHYFDRHVIAGSPSISLSLIVGKSKCDAKASVTPQLFFFFP